MWILTTKDKEPKEANVLIVDAKGTARLLTGFNSNLVSIEAKDIIAVTNDKQHMDFIIEEIKKTL